MLNFTKCIERPEKSQWYFRTELRSPTLRQLDLECFDVVTSDGAENMVFAGTAKRPTQLEDRVIDAVAARPRLNYPVGHYSEPQGVCYSD